MNYEQRKQIVGRWVHNLHTVDFVPPRGFTDEAAQNEAKEVVKAIVGLMPSPLNEDQFTETLSAARSRLKRNAKTRAWPILSEIIEAVGASLPRGVMAEETRTELSRQTTTWFAKYIDRGMVPPSKYWDADAARQMVREGMTDVHRIYATGWLLPADLQRQRLEDLEREGVISERDEDLLNQLRGNARGREHMEAQG